MLRDTAASVSSKKYSSVVGNSRPTSLKIGDSSNPAVEKGTVAVQSSSVTSTLAQSGRSEGQDTIEDERKENHQETVLTRRTTGIQIDDISPLDDDNHVLIVGESPPLGRCARLYHMIKSNPRRSFAVLIFIIGITVMSVYVDAIVE